MFREIKMYEYVEGKINNLGFEVYVGKIRN